MDLEDDEELAFILNGVVAAVVAYADPSYSKEPYHTCPFTSLDWLRDLMNGHPRRIRDTLRVHLLVFKALLHVLRKIGYSDSKHVTLEEQLAIFLYASVTGLST